MKTPSSSPPVLSIVVVVYNMASQALNTLRSLSHPYQSIDKELYEVIVVENQSENMLEEKTIASIGNQFHYYKRVDNSVSPVFAANYGLAKCRGRYIGMMIDGARLLSPGVLSNVVRCFQANENALCLVPGYQLESPAQKADMSVSPESEQAWLKTLVWKKDGYRLFNNAIPSPGNRFGYLNPFMECNCLFAHRQFFERIGGLDESFTLAGGGAINLHLMRQLGMQKDICPIVLAGEGSFHQAHGGVTTTESSYRESLLRDFKQQLDQAWGGKFHALRREVKLLGKISPAALPELKHSCEQAIIRFNALQVAQRPDWEDEPAIAIPIKKTSAEKSPKLSVIAIGYRMPDQLENTLYSLSIEYQKGVIATDYEVIVVENSSSENLDLSVLDKLEGNFQYHLREESGVSPVSALNFGVARANGEFLCIIVDGARLLSPGVIRNALDCIEMFDSPMIVVPGYHIGDQEHEHCQESQMESERKLLKEIDWKKNGYRLFEQACFSVGNRNGFFHPFMECSALFCSKVAMKKIGGADSRFTYPGGGSFNLHLYRQLGLLAENQLIILPGEGSFHQYHGGVTTSRMTDRQDHLEKFNEQLNGYWGGQFKALTREPFFYGSIPKQALPFLLNSAQAGIHRYARMQRTHAHPWPDDLELAGNQE